MIETDYVSGNYVPGDIIAGMFYYFDRPFFTGDYKKIHETIFEARGKFDILKVFPFSEGEVFPFSRKLEEVLQRLELSRIIGMENPDFKRFIVKTQAKEYLKERILPLFDDEEKKQLEDLGKYFSRICGDE